MEINKVTFETIKTDEITKSFDDLDVNSDGKIDETDKTATTDTTISEQITKVLSLAVDEDSELEDSESTETTGSTGTTDKTSEESGEYTKLKAQLDKINEEISGIDTQLTALKAENTELEKQKAELDEEQETKQKAADEASQKLQEEQETLANYIKKYEEVQEEVEKLNKEILKEQESEDQEYQDSIETITNNAINNYDATKDGDDFDAYLQKQLSNNGYPIFSNLDYLNSQSEGLSDNAKSILRNINSQTSVVHFAKVKVDTANNALTDVTNRAKTVADKINTNNTAITGLEALKTTKKINLSTITDKMSELNSEQNISGITRTDLSASELLALIPEKEKQLAINANVDVKKCVIAQGNDGVFHIYEGTTSIARLYAYLLPGEHQVSCDGDDGIDIVPKGSGRIYTEEYANGKIALPSIWGTNLAQEKEYGEIKKVCAPERPVYSLESVNECWTDGEISGCCNCSYKTCTPLSFDVDGDGVKTTEETVSFDIDGDGELDTVNNSAEWVLAFDKDGNGKAGENGSELFGDNTDLDGDGVKDGYSDGFAALKALAQKEGLISSTDSVLDADDIKKLSEKYGLVMTNGYGGEAKSLADLGITEINLAQTTDTTLTKNFDGRNNDIMTQEGATFVVNGETREYADIWNAKKDSSEAVTKADESEYVVKQATVKEADIKSTDNKKLKLTLNNDRVVALEGKVAYKSIEKLITSKADAPDEILNEIIEVNEDEE